MTLEQYIDDGLKKYTSAQARSDSQIDREALRLEEEYMSKTSSQRNVDRAKEMFKNDPDFMRRVEAMEESPEAFAQSVKPLGLRTAEATFPRAMRASQEGSKFPIGSVAQDMMSYPLRYGEAVINKANPFGTDESIEQRMAQESTGEFIADAMRSPYNVMPASRIGGGLASVAKAPLQKAISYFGQGAAEQLPSAIMEQQARMEQGKGFSPTEFGAEIVAGGVLPVGGKIAKRALFGSKAYSKNGISEVAKSALSATSGKSKELLSYIGSDELKDGVKSLIKSNAKPSEKISKIQNYQKNAEDVVGGIIDFIDTGFKDRYIESNLGVKQALKEMGEIDVSDIVLDLNRKKKAVLDPRDPLKQTNIIVPKGHTTGDEAIDVRLSNYDNIIDKLTGRNYGEQRFTIPASQLYDIRKDIDKSINFDKTKYSTGLNKELSGIPKDVRNKLAEKLRVAGENTSFPKEMKTFHEGINLADELSKKFGDGSDLDKSARFLTTLGNPNKLQSKVLAKKLEKFLGKDMFEESQLLKLSKEYNDGLSVYNDINTGRSMLSPVLGEKLAGKTGAFVGATLGSPKIAAPAMRGIEAVEESADYLSPMIRTLMRSGQAEAIGE